MEANPNSGAAGFDHILFAATNIFQSITLEGWVDLMYMLQVSRPGIAQVYFLLVVFFGAFFVINLFLVVISDNYLEASRSAEAELEQLQLPSISLYLPISPCISPGPPRRSSSSCSSAA